MQSPEHLDEGTIHAWLDGQLPPGEAAVVEAHAASCTACGEAVAEARGFVAGATRVLGALDDPGGVGRGMGGVASGAGDSSKSAVIGLAARRRRRRWMIPSAAAATLFIASVTMLSVRDSQKGAPEAGEAALSSAVLADSSVAAAPPAVATAVSPAPAPSPGPGSPSSAANVSGGGAAAGAAGGATELRRLAAKDAPREQTAVADAATEGQVPPAAAPAARMEAARVAAAPARPDSITLEVYRGGRTDRSRFSAEMAKAGTPVAQTAAPSASCWVVVGDVPGLPQRFVLDTAATLARAEGQGLRRVRVGATPGAGADVGSWRPLAGDSVVLTLNTGSASRAAAFAPPPPGQVVRLLLPVPAAVRVDTLLLRRVECVP